MANNVNAHPFLEPLRRVFPNAKVTVVGDKVKFNSPELNLEQIQTIATLPELKDVEIKRSGTGVVVILK